MNAAVWPLFNGLFYSLCAPMGFSVPRKRFNRLVVKQAKRFPKVGFLLHRIKGRFSRKEERVCRKEGRFYRKKRSFCRKGRRFCGKLGRFCRKNEGFMEKALSIRMKILSKRRKAFCECIHLFRQLPFIVFNPDEDNYLLISVNCSSFSSIIITIIIISFFLFFFFFFSFSFFFSFFFSFSFFFFFCRLAAYGLTLG